jgi:hypothetical protein
MKNGINILKKLFINFNLFNCLVFVSFYLIDVLNIHKGNNEKYYKGYFRSSEQILKYTVLAYNKSKL